MLAMISKENRGKNEFHLCSSIQFVYLMNVESTLLTKEAAPECQIFPCIKLIATLQLGFLHNAVKQWPQRRRFVRKAEFKTCVCDMKR